MGRAHFRFLKSYLSTPGNVGAVAPSSPYLARRMIEELDLEGADTVVELGPGTGAFTGFILDGLASIRAMFDAKSPWAAWRARST